MSLPKHVSRISKSDAVRISLVTAFLLAGCASAPGSRGAQEWRSVRKGVGYRDFSSPGLVAHVVRIDLGDLDLQVIVSSHADQGTTVGAFATKHHAEVAVNGDYFKDTMAPLGLTIGHCGRWPETSDTEREAVLAFGKGQARIYRQAEVVDPPQSWMSAVVSGWPMLVDDCKVIDPLPGSDPFTKGPHARTVAALSEDRRTLFLIAADGGQRDAPGSSLAALAQFARTELGACSAINLDGGGSTTMIVAGKLKNRPSDGKQRPVGNHLGIVSGAVACDDDGQR